jgi:hypothetical protein
MNPQTFLSAIWPDNGLFALATLFKIPGTNTVTYTHKVFETVAAAAAFVKKEAPRNDIYFAVHSLKEARVWNPEKVDRKTGELGAYEVRTHQNMQEAKAFFFDLDVGESKPNRAPKYATQQDALADLIRFCKETQLPRPLVTSSGGGLHVYWLLSSSIPSPEWKQHAAKLRQLAAHHALRVDPARTTDVASVLRVAGTFNFKDKANPRPVVVLASGSPTPVGEFLKRVTDALTRAGVTPKAMVEFPAEAQNLSILGTNIVDDVVGPPVSMKALVTACAQMRRLVGLKGDVSEPEWYHSINLARFLEDGDKWVHRISSGHPDYNAGATDEKIANLRAKGIKPTSCAKLAEVSGDHLCEGCAFAGRVKSPIVAAKFKDPAPQPVVQQMVGTVVHTTDVPDPPFPFQRMKGGAISVTAKNSEGDEINTVIYDHDIYPVRRLVNDASETEQQMWRVVLPRSGAKDFTIDADALYDRRKFVTAVSNHGIYPKHGNLQLLQEYMTAYINELQRLTDAEAQCNHLGWNDDRSQFIMPDKILCKDGVAKPAMLSLGASRATSNIRKKGTLQRQVELLNFYNHPAYLPNQFYILAGLAAPIFYATGHHGVIVNVTGVAGASKSSSLYTAASFWGDPVLYPINGTNNGATVRGRNERVTTLANLPICVDEITNLPAKDAVDLAMSITQPGHRIRLDTAGVERASSGGYKATMMLTNANNSLHSLLSLDNAAGTAGSMRVVEITFTPCDVHKKHEADDYLYDLKENYGHIGEQFIAYVIQNEAAVAARVREVMREIDITSGIQGAERFWSASIAAVVVAAEVAHSLGLCPFDAKSVRDWALRVQIPSMRGTVVSEYDTPLGTLANYLEKINGDLLVLGKPTGGNISYAIRAPRGQMLGHYDMHERVMWVLKKPFKEYCATMGSSAAKILQELSYPKTDVNGKQSRIILNPHVKKVLGSGTDHAKAQAWCFSVNMDHPDVTGAVELSVVSGSGDTTTPAKGAVKAV